MKKIKETIIIQNTDVGKFDEMLNRRINEIQDNGLDLEIQYSIANVGYGMVYSALIIVR